MINNINDIDYTIYIHLNIENYITSYLNFFRRKRHFGFKFFFFLKKLKPIVIIKIQTRGNVQLKLKSFLSKFELFEPDTEDCCSIT